MDFILTSRQVLEEISKIEESSSTSLVAYTGIIKYCRSILNDYRLKIKEVAFKSALQEIQFFKIEKQIPLVHLIYYINLRNLELNYSLKYRRKLLHKQIKKINKFFQKHREFQLYVDLGNSYMDKIYYTREFQDKGESHNDILYWDPDFSTSHDLLLAQLKAYQRLLPFLQNELDRCNYPENKNIIDHDLNWTASKVDLIELIYALHFSGAINNGSANIIDIVSLFEKIFDEKLGNCYKKVSEIKGRKGRITKFLDEITWNFEQKLNRDNAL